MLLKELIRFSTQHRTLYCYMILSVWIFLLITGMYKYIGYQVEGNALNGGKTPIQSLVSEHLTENAETKRLRQFKEICMPLQRLVRQDDGGVLDGWSLQGVLLVIRHGDRGPMSHVRAVSDIDCGIVGDILVHKYRSFLHNSTNSASGANHLYWQKMGPFHGFALLPATEKYCLLGQLTFKGIAQMLHVGELLHQIYAHSLGLLQRPVAPRTADATPHSLLNSDEVLLYTTRYRRTFQSALALLYTFLPTEKWLTINVRESHSMAFCFNDCACGQAEALRKRLQLLNYKAIMQQPQLLQVLQQLGNNLLQYSSTNSRGFNEPNEVVDAMLSVLCHDGVLPCRRWLTNATAQQYDMSTTTTTTSSLDLSDVINIDQDDTAANLLDANLGLKPQTSQRSEASTEACLDATQHVSTVLDYALEQSKYEAGHKHYREIGLMKAYGMIRHIVSHMLKMISGDRSKFVLYSGHDWTLQYLTAALGIRVKNTFIAYASRLAFELYKSETHTDYYFRVVYNGQDVTQQIDFCEGGKSLRVARDSRGNKADLCPIENIIRFLHEDYFSTLNATNFKDACTVQANLQDLF